MAGSLSHVIAGKEKGKCVSKAIFGPAGRSEVNSTLIQSARINTRGRLTFTPGFPSFQPSWKLSPLSSPPSGLTRAFRSGARDGLWLQMWAAETPNLKNIRRLITACKRRTDTSFWTFTREMSIRAKVWSFIGVKSERREEHKTGQIHSSNQHLLLY